MGGRSGGPSESAWHSRQFRHHTGQERTACQGSSLPGWGNASIGRDSSFTDEAVSAVSSLAKAKQCSKSSLDAELQAHPLKGSGSSGTCLWQVMQSTNFMARTSLCPKLRCKARLFPQVTKS